MLRSRRLFSSFTVRFFAFKGAAAGMLAIMAGAAGLLAVTTFGAGPADAQSSVRPPAGATSNALPRGADGVSPARRSQPTNVTGGRVPGNTLGSRSQTDFWRALRQGDVGNTQVGGAQSGQVIRGSDNRLTTLQQIEAAQSGAATGGGIGLNVTSNGWREVRTGLLPKIGMYAVGGMLGLLAVFFLVRGRIRIDAGRCSETITRFATVERMAHWLLAVSFIILALTGLNLVYGKTVLLPLLGKGVFASITTLGKSVHSYVAFSFMLGLAMIVVFWIRDNLPSRTDLAWVMKGGGMFGGSHPPAKRFNFGQKIIFWAVVLGGVSISATGIALMFPYQTAMFAKTFGILNSLGLDLPQQVTPIQEQQLATLWHSIMAMVLTAIIVAHIYIGTLGMEGAFDAMGSGEVDANWAREHHSIWYEEMTGRSADSGRGGHGGTPPPAAAPAGAEPPPVPAE